MGSVTIVSPRWLKLFGSYRRLKIGISPCFATGSRVIPNSVLCLRLGGVVDPGESGPITWIYDSEIRYGNLAPSSDPQITSFVDLAVLNRLVPHPRPSDYHPFFRFLRTASLKIKKESNH